VEERDKGNTGKDIAEFFYVQGLLTSLEELLCGSRNHHPAVFCTSFWGI